MTTFFIEQFGCRATQADGAAIERQLLNRGCTAAADASSADVVVVNTCTVTAAADAQARDAIRKIHKRNPKTRIMATGCYAQRAPEELAELPGVSWVIGNSHKPEIAALVSHEINGCSGFVPASALNSSPESQQGFVLKQNAPSSTNKISRSACIADYAENPSPQYEAKILTGDIFEYHHFLSAPILGGEGERTRPTLKIQDGCNLRCTYCVIPFVRGRSRSMPADGVIAAVQSLVDSGAREIVLSGINLGTWGRDLSPRVELIVLLRRILDETSVDRLRLSSIEPQDVTQDIVDLFAANDRLADHFHMPLQSGSDKILAAMHRWYRTEHYARRVELIRERLPHAAIGADVIAGFPGETEADHSATLAFIEQLPFTYLHVFSYSKRPGTKAASLPNQAPGHIIKRRARELRALDEAKSAAFRKSQVGRTLRVLTLRPDAAADSQSTPALSSNYVKLSLPGTLPPNLWRNVTLVVNEKLAEGQLVLEDDLSQSFGFRMGDT